VTPIDVLVRIGMLHQGHVDVWRRGRISELESGLQGTRRKLEMALEAVSEWARARGLRTSETPYVRRSPVGQEELRFTVAGDPAIEQAIRTHWLSTAVDEKREQKIKAKLEKQERPVVFEILREAKCTECGVEIERDGFLFMEKGQPLCLSCANLGGLEFLPAGDIALTRRSTKHSARMAVVVRFSRSRGRYERQGILAEPEAIERAEKECSADAGERAEARKRAVAVRERQDAEFTREFARRILELFPRCPAKEALRIAGHAATRGSGRVGRSAAGRALEEEAVRLAVIASVRHRHTRYDEMLGTGSDREDARSRVRGEVEDVLDSWG
jgi:hypothetical protein